MTGLAAKCGLIALFPPPSTELIWVHIGVGKRVIAMARQVDTSEVFKQPVHCFRCDDAFYFTLRAIAEDEKLKCPVCGTGINLSDDRYKSLVASVRYTIKSICDRGPTEQLRSVVYDRMT
jgi:hypothetical protein